MQNIEQQLLLLKHNLPLFCSKFLKVVNTNGDLVPLILNTSQLALHAAAEQQLKEIGMVRLVVPKGRKQGISSYVAARFFHKALFNSYKKVYILSHHSDTTKILFDIVATYYQNLPEQLKLSLIVDNSRELVLDNHSSYTVATAGSGEIGRGATPHLLHASEAASFENPEAIESGIFNAIAMAADTEMFIESTAKGIGNLFHRYAMTAIEGLGFFRMKFLPWYIHEDNKFKCPTGFIFSPQDLEEQKKYNLTDDQLYWRRLKINTTSPRQFKQEYPATVQEAFQASGETLLDSELVHAARTSGIKDKNKPLIIGVDPAGQGGDRTAICWRRGREWVKYKTFEIMEPMRLAGILAQIINEDNPAKVFVDVAMGYGTIDRLHELGFSRVVQGVHASESPLDKELYGNKRAEMAFAIRDWFREGEVSIPDDDDVEMDLLCIPEEKESSSGRFMIIPKKDIKKKFGKSPDIFDAFALTFAYPVRANVENANGLYYNVNKPKKQSEFSSRVMNDFSRGQANKKKGFGIKWDF